MQIYNFILEDSTDIVDFFEDQSGGELCLAFFLDVCHALIEKGKVDALSCVIESMYTICEIPKRWDDGKERWDKIFIEVMETQVLE